MTARRAVLDPNVLVSALLSPSGRPAALVSRWQSGEFEVVISEDLLAELRRTLSYPKIRSRITDDQAMAFIDLVRRTATLVEDPAARQRLSRDPGDDYLLALAEAASAILVTGDHDLLALAELPIRTVGTFLESLEGGR